MSAQTNHLRIEGAEHGAKSLVQFIQDAKESGAAGAQAMDFEAGCEGARMSMLEVLKLGEAKGRQEGREEGGRSWEGGQEGCSGVAFEALDAAYWTVRRLRPCLAGREDAGGGGPGAGGDGEGDGESDFRQGYGVIWCAARMWFKRKTGCQCSGECLCLEEVEDLTAEVGEKLEKHLASGGRAFGIPSVVIYRMCRSVWADRMEKVAASRGALGNLLPIEEAKEVAESGEREFREEIQRFAREWRDGRVFPKGERMIFDSWFFSGETLDWIARSSKRSLAATQRVKEKWCRALEKAFWSGAGVSNDKLKKKKRERYGITH